MLSGGKNPSSKEANSKEHLSSLNFLELGGRRGLGPGCSESWGSPILQYTQQQLLIPKSEQLGTTLYGRLPKDRRQWAILPSFSPCQKRVRERVEETEAGFPDSGVWRVRLHVLPNGVSSGGQTVYFPSSLSWVFALLLLLHRLNHLSTIYQIPHSSHVSNFVPLNLAKKGKIFQKDHILKVVRFEK